MTSVGTTTGRGPRGWDRLVMQLNAAPDAPSFQRGMLDIQCKIVAAEYGALWVADQGGEPRIAMMWPEKPQQDVPADSPLMTVLAQAAKQGLERGVSHVLKIEAETQEAGADLGAHVFVTVLRVKGRVVGMTTVVAECRDAAVLQQTMPLRELAAGLYEGFQARIEASQRELEAQRVRQAMALLALSQEGEGFNGATMNLVNELARQLKCTRVSIGWIHGRMVRLVAMSDTEHIKRHGEEVALTELAMAECLDQQQPIVVPVPEQAEAVLQQAVVHSHRRLIGSQPGRHALSLPLRHRDEWIGVVTLERAEAPFDPGMIQFLQLTMDVVAPHLLDRRNSDRWLVGHAWKSIETGAAYVVGPKHVAWKLGALVVAAVLAFVVFGHWNYRVSAPFVFESHDRRILPAPYEGRLVAVNAEPGAPIKAGDVLASLDTTQFRLQLDEAQAKFDLAELDRRNAQTERKWGQMEQAIAAKRQAMARINLLTYEIESGTIRSPVDGYVLSGSWRDKIGGVVKQGDQLFEVSPLRELVATIHVDERDADLINFMSGQHGELATRSRPDQTVNFVVNHVVPAAGPVKTVNAFEVRASLDQPAIWLRPGMEGLAKIEVGSKPIYWILSHRLVDTVRLWLWW
ncbi:MAG: HlyD family efflux transporter periplasmic adaptor subunit [Planctomycetes bacterium]|nr:HlyD family efflux transporter periplasmic adaptor subunit [Planctomycetota bacterium]